MGLHRQGWGLRPVIAWILATSLALLSFPSAAGPMDLGGQFAVNTLGGATYVIPLQAPPGTGGIEPRLALSYSSQSGNGLLGVGWGLSGLSAITRCARTLAQDGVNGRVNYDANDRYCLDGQRLLVVTGSYGADGAEYRTERDTFSKIVSYGTAGNGPSWFKVWTKSGQIIEYGNTADSKIEVVAVAGATPAWSAGSVRAWAQNKRADTSGNDLTVTYTEEATNGNYYPQRIDYTGNATTGLAPTNSVQLTYEAKPDVITRYGPSSFSRNTVRLTTVNLYTGATLSGVYQLAYDNAGVSLRSRLKSITQCDGAGVCLPPIQLALHNGGAGIAQSNNSIQTVSGDWKSAFTAYTGDFNGDGSADLYLAGTAASYFCAGPGVASSNNCVQTATGDWKDAFAINPGDFNGDGITDLYLIGWTASYFCPGPGIATAANCIQTVTGDWRSSFAVHKGDVNGDGITDLYLLGTTASYFCSGPGIATGNNCVQTVTSNWKDSYTAYPGDVNGDGITDLYLVGTTASYFCAGPGIATSNNCVQTATGNWKDSYKLHPGDFNGDGITDLYLVGTTASYFCAGPDIATRNNCVQTTTGNWKDTYDVHPADYNGDGMTDLYLVGTTASYFCAGPGIASSNNCAQTVTGNWKGSYSIFPGDYNGDGAADLYLLGAAGSSFAAGGGAQSDLVQTVSNSLGAVLTWTYAPLTSAVYTKAPVSTYPILSLQQPMTVVSSVANANGVGGTLTTQYTYGGLKAEAGTGRGLLGFGWITATQVDTGLSTRTDYRQDWPYVGLPSQIKKTLPAASGPGNQINLVSNTYGCFNPQTGSPCTVAIGHRYVPYLSQTIESTWDLNGAALPVVTATNQFDPYGNATQVAVTTGDGFVKTTTNTYRNDTALWFIGQLLSTQVQSATGVAVTVGATLPTLSVSRSPSPMLAGQPYTVTWASTNATAVSYVCTASGTGLAGSATVAVNGSSTGTASAAWVGYPSTCTWTATGPGGSTTASETLTTLTPVVPSAPTAPTFNLSRSPSPMVAGRSYTLTWTSTNATSISYVCTASGTGYVASGTLPTSGSSTGTASAAWIGYPSTCTYTIIGAGGKGTAVETLTTVVPTFTLTQTITGSGANYNLRAQAVTAGWNQSDVLVAQITVAAGVTVYSANTATPAFTTGSGFPAGSQLTVTNNGSIFGSGGAGGSGGYTGSKNGSAGGPAFQAAAAVTVYNNGVIGGGGGGGASGGTASTSTYGVSSQGGAGGKGQGPGAAMAGSPAQPVWYEDSWHTGGTGATGGSYGMPGGSSSPRTGGAAGACTLGNANITWAVAGTRRGPVQ